jgi:hypothetical protein
MPLRIDLDFHQGLTVPKVDRAGDGTLQLSLARGAEQVVVHLSLPSLEALWFELTTKLAELRQS